jgi:hypothetical protein
MFGLLGPLPVEGCSASDRLVMPTSLPNRSVAGVIALDLVRSENAEGEQRGAYGQDQECHHRQHRAG